MQFEHYDYLHLKYRSKRPLHEKHHFLSTSSLSKTSIIHFNNFMKFASLFEFWGWGQKIPCKIGSWYFWYFSSSSEKHLVTTGRAGDSAGRQIWLISAAASPPPPLFSNHSSLLFLQRAPCYFSRPQYSWMHKWDGWSFSDLDSTPYFFCAKNLICVDFEEEMTTLAYYLMVEFFYRWISTNQNGLFTAF